MAREFLSVLDEAEEIPQESVSNLTEEGTDDHVQFLLNDSLLAALEHPLNDKGDKEDVDGQEGEVAQETEPDLLPLAENQVINAVQGE
jgi:hypothetical protein